MYDISYDEATIPKYKVISVSSSGDNSLSIQVAGQIIKVLQIEYTGHGGVNVTMKSGSTALEGAMALLYGTGKVRNGTRSVPVFKCGIGEDLIVNLSQAVQVSGSVVYTTQDND